MGSSDPREDISLKKTRIALWNERDILNKVGLNLDIRVGEDKPTCYNGRGEMRFSIDREIFDWSSISQRPLCLGDKAPGALTIHNNKYIQDYCKVLRIQTFDHKK